MRRWRHEGQGARLAVGLLVGLLAACQAQTAEPSVRARAVPLQEDQPDRVALDALRFEAGFQLSAADRRFGGLSGLWLAPDGHELVMVSDHGTVWRATLQHDGDRLTGFADWQAAALGQVAGDGARDIDAEELADDGAGGLIVAVEGALPLRHITHDDPASATPHRAATRLAEDGAADGNAGIEALTSLPDGSLLALSEGDYAGPGQLKAWRVEDGDITPLRYATSDGFVPTGADRLHDTIYIVERRFSLLDGGFATRIAALDLKQVREGEPMRPRLLALLGRPAISENFEGIAVRRSADGRPLIYLMSDDNFLPLQRTLLLQFSLPGP